MKFFVNGDPVDVALDPQAPLRHGMQQALSQSNNTGRPLVDWELRDEMGRLLSPEDSLVQHTWLVDAEYLFVTPRVGVGG